MITFWFWCLILNSEVPNNPIFEYLRYLHPALCQNPPTIPPVAPDPQQQITDSIGSQGCLAVSLQLEPEFRRSRIWLKKLHDQRRLNNNGM